jgi:hypothetical protein
MVEGDLGAVEMREWFDESERGGVVGAAVRSPPEEEHEVAHLRLVPPLFFSLFFFRLEHYRFLAIMASQLSQVDSVYADGCILVGFGCFGDLLLFWFGDDAHINLFII